MDKPLVSIVIPVYNGENYLREAIASAVAQTWQALEIIVVDDGSQDRSAEIASTFAGVTVLRKANGGVASARNAGIATAKGEFLAFLDHDDVQHPEKTARQVAALAANPMSGFALCHKQYVIEGAVPRWFRGPTDGSPVQGFVPSCWLVRRGTIEKVGLFDERYPNGSDYDWLARAKDVGVEYVMLPEVLVSYRVHGSNDSSNGRAVKRDMLLLLRESLERRKWPEKR